MTAIMFFAMFVEEFLKVHPNARYIILAFVLFVIGIAIGYHIKEYSERYIKDKEIEQQLNEIEDMLYNNKKDKDGKEISEYEKLLKEFR